MKGHEWWGEETREMTRAMGLLYTAALMDGFDGNKERSLFTYRLVGPVDAATVEALSGATLSQGERAEIENRVGTIFVLDHAGNAWHHSYTDTAKLFGDWRAL